MGVAFLGDCKGTAQLHGIGTQSLQARNVFKTAHASGRNQRDVLLIPRVFEKLAHLWNHVFKVKPGVLQVGNLGGAQVTTRQARVFDHDGIRQALLALPLFHQQLHTARVGEDGNQRRLGVVFGQVRQVQWQAGAYHHGVNAALQRFGHVGGVLAHGAHHIDGQQAPSTGAGPGGLNFTVNGNQVGRIDARLGRIARRQLARLVHQVGVVAAQVHAG